MARKQKKEPAKRGWFLRFAKATANATGKPYAFMLASATILVWGISGPFFGYSDTWQLVINTGTTIITFLMVFLIQNTQNRDSKAVQLKLDELLRTSDGAHNALLDLEELSDKELQAICQKYHEMAEIARTALRHGKADTDQPNINLEENPKPKKRIIARKRR